ncbi:hypothetical protein HK100_004051 [Physocladia obscura]|uniref:TIR domain-containing protein n=1 Tax=Physocladia obscura TaxID=109957 RepID=A0AAD5SVI2_9FUNG|nr:hypothetical protein HK100_004051 [Physocladia obscura]
MCRRQLAFAAELKKDVIIPIRLDGGPFPICQFLTAGLFYFDFALSANDAMYSQLLVEVQKRVLEQHNKRISAVVKVSPSSAETDVSATVKNPESWDVMISYSHTQQAQVMELKKYIIKNGFTVWLDTEQMYGDIYERMSEAVKKCKTVVACLSKDYENSANCRRELTFASETKKDFIIPVRMDSGPFPTCQFLTSEIFYIDLSDLDTPHMKMSAFYLVVSEIHERIHGNTAKISVAGHIASSKHSLTVPDFAAIKNFLQPVDMDEDISVLQTKLSVGTRTLLLDKITGWSRVPTSRLFRLTGPPGSGKSVIAAAVARVLENNGFLIAKFFCRFDIGERHEPKRLIRTIAYQLALEISGVAQYITELLQDKPDLFESVRSVSYLFDLLIKKPLMKYPIAKCCIVIIDALDELLADKRGELFAVLRDDQNWPPGLLLVTTSRPEVDILQADLASMRENYIELSAEWNKADIKAYAENKVQMWLKVDRISLNDCDSIVTKLTEFAGGLFIWIFQACIQLESSSDIKAALDDLEKLILTSISAGGKNIDSIYQKTLQKVIKDDDEEIYQSMFGTIIAAQSLLSISDIAALLILPESRVRGFVAHMRSLLVITDLSIGILHKSVADYVTSGYCPPRFFINIEKANAILANSCLRILTTEVKSSAIDSVSILSGDTDDIPLNAPTLRYSAIYWMYHFENSGVSHNVEMLESFAQRHGESAFNAAVFAGKATICRKLSNSIAQVRCIVPQGVAARCEIGYFPFPLLFLAAKRGDLEVCSVLLALGADINCRGEHGRTPLIAAVIENFIELVKFFLQSEADYDAEDIAGQKAEQYAGLESLKLIKERKRKNWLEEKNMTEPHELATRGDLNGLISLDKLSMPMFFITNEKKRTPAWYAAAYNHISVLEWLFQKSFDINIPDRHGCTPLFVSAMMGHVETVKWLIKHSNIIDQPNDDDETPLWVAAEFGQLHIVQLLVSAGCEAGKKNKTGASPLWIAAANGHIGVIKWLSSNGGKFDAPNNEHVSPLWIAACNGHLEIVEWLSQIGCDVEMQNSIGRTPLLIAAGSNHLNIVKWLVKCGGNVNTADHLQESPLWIAAGCGNLEVVKWLSENGASVLSKDYDGRTPLWLAAWSGYLETVKWLAANGCDLQISTNLNTTPLWIAAWSGHFQIVKWLVANGGVDIPNQDGRTALWSAAYTGQLAIVKWLVKNGSDARISDNDGASPLFVAIENGHIEIVKFLMGLNVDVEPPINNNRELLAVATWNRRLEIVKWPAKERNHDTPLVLAAKKGRAELQKYISAGGV